MPWEERSLMDVRLRFVQDVHRPGWSVAEVCRRYEVSRKTGYKWLERYGTAGPAGLVDRSHRPYSCPHATPAAVVEQILGLQRRYRWGARKVRWLLAQRVPIELVPTVATVHRILERSEEHTSELQSLAYLVCRLLLEKKKNKDSAS